MKKICLLFSLVLILRACWMDIDWSIRIINNSNKTIYVFADFIYPEKSLPVDKPNYFREIKPKSMGNLRAQFFNDWGFKRFQQEKLTLFILDKDVVDTKTWEYIRENDIVLKRYEGRMDDFPRNNGVEVYYP